MKPSDQIRAYIKAHPDQIIEDVAELFDRHINQIRGYAKDVGVKLKTRRQEQGHDWLTHEDDIEADRRLAELMKDPRVVRWLEENSFEILK